MNKIIVSLLFDVLLIAVSVAFGREDEIRTPPIPYGDQIASIQRVIAAGDTPGGFYVTSYSKAEPFYWSKILAWMHEEAPPHRVLRVLDIGCGYGTLLAHASQFYGARGYCMDITPYLSERVRSTYGLTFAKGNIELDPIPWSEKYEVIILTEVLEHLNFRPVPTLRKIREGLSPGGRLYLSTPEQETWGKVTKYCRRLRDLTPPKAGTPIIDDHIWVFSRKELLTTMKAAGLRVERIDLSRAPNGLRHFNVVAVAD